MMSLVKGVMESALKALNISCLNPLQSNALNALADTKRLVILAPPRSGKTLAYLLPIFNKLKKEELDHEQMNSSHPRAIILVPTAEMAVQVGTIAKQLSHHIRLRVNKFDPVNSKLDAGRDLAVMTPRTWEQNGFLKPKIMVLDEADILLKNSTTKRTIESTQIDTVIISTLQDPVLKNFQIISHHTNDSYPLLNRRNSPLIELLKKYNNEKTLLMCNSIQTASRLYSELEKLNIASLVHHRIPDYQRLVLWNHFKHNRIQNLICTDLVARDLDTVGFVDHIIFCDEPVNNLDLQHRVSRTLKRISVLSYNNTR